MTTPTPGAAPQAAEHTPPRHHSETDDVSRSYEMNHVCGVCGETWGNHAGIRCPNGATVFSPVEIVGLVKLYTIKPLEWKPTSIGAFADTLIGRVWVSYHGEWAWGGALIGGDCASLADGQAQAEACWQARLAGVLEEQR